jgi:hypothetical protein
MTATPHNACGIGFVLAFFLIVGGFLSIAYADSSPQGLTQQRDKQKDVRSDTDHVVRRTGTMLRVLDYYKLDRSAEKRLLDEVAGTLAGLSKEQMADVIARLEKATRISNQKEVLTEVDRAYDQHREILIRLKELLSRYEAVKTLDQAAERLGKAATTQLEMHLQTTQHIQDYRDAAQPQRRNVERRSRQAVMTEVQHEADEQRDLQKDVNQTLKQLSVLKDLLPPEERQRLTQAEKMAGEQRLLENQAKAAEQLQTRDQREQNWKAAAETQRKAAADLQDVARALRTPSEKLAALREARDRVERAGQKQDQLRAEAHAQQDPRVQDQEKQQRKEGQARRSQEMGDQQARLAHETRDVQNLLKPHANELANKVSPAETSMRQAEDALRKKSPQEAVKPQSQATETLDEVRKDLDRMIAQAEKQQSDPLAALQKAAETVDRLIKEQKDARNKTQEATQTKHPERLPPLAGKQEDLAKRTDDLSQQPTPAKPQTQAALDKAARAMEEAGKALQQKKGAEAQPSQNQAVKSLEEAQKQLGEQIAEVEKRRADMAALEEASKKLDEVTQKEAKVGEQAKSMAQKQEASGAEELAKQQGELTPQAKDIGKSIEKAAPEAAKHVAKGAEKMDTAKKNLDDKQVSPAARKAAEATRDLQEAQKALAKARDEQTGKEIADQAAMEAGKIDPANAARQIAKALEQTKRAAESSQQASKQLPKPARKPADQPDLAKLQQQIADQANKTNLPEAGKPAETAARELEKGNLESAVEQQKKALEQFREQAKKEAQAQGKSQESKASELASDQKALLDATQALAKSQEANQAATAALEQAQAQAPSTVQPQLQKAGKELAQANQQLNQGTPARAHQSQQEAGAQLSKALQALNNALAAMGQPQAQPGARPSEELASALQSGQKPGQGQKPSPGKKPGKGQAQEKNQAKGTGDRIASASPNNAASQLKEVKGEGSFLQLPARQREMILQALNTKLPPEYAAMIQQYYINIAGGKPAAKAGTAEKP